MLCTQCDMSIHTTQVLHNREVWIGSCFKPVSTTEFVDENTDDIVQIGLEC